MEPTELFEKLVVEIQKYNPDSDIAQIKKAYEFASIAHGTATRLTGDIYMVHPLNVALILADLRMDDVSIMAALLHDVVEDTPYTLTDIDKEFGTEVAFIVNGLTDIKLLTKNANEESKLITRATQLVLASTEDIRVLIIRLADKLNNLQTLHGLPDDRAHRFATRVLKIYAPLADFIGGRKLKKELEDLAFKQLNPKMYELISSELEKYYNVVELGDIIHQIEDILHLNHIKFTSVFARTKGIYSTYMKLKRYIKRGDFTEINANSIKEIVDKIGLTILVDSVADCYNVLGIIHTKYPTVPGSFDDYISIPKPSGYKSIQTGIEINTERGSTTLEMQIKTNAMHEFNEFGPASHILYKLKQFSGDTASLQTFSIESLKSLSEWSKDSIGTEKFKLKMFDESIFVFTKDTDIVVLPKGSNPVDFAYALHSSIGEHIGGVKVNGKLVTLSTILKTGDKLEIMVSKTPTVSSDWLKFANKTTQRRIRKSLLQRKEV